MPRYPHTKLFSDPRRIVVLSGPHIQVLDPKTGHILHSTAKLSLEDGHVFVNGGPIRCSGVSRDGRYLATTGDDKRLNIWDLESLTLLSSRELPKRPTSVVFTRNTNILVSDKFGDVFRYELHPKSELIKEISTVNNLHPTSHENPSSGELVLGHASLLTSCLLTSDEKFIITADRDEHIRVSWYPEGYVIESYCLGHKKYVSAIHIPVESPVILLSGGGDFDLKVWDWMTGRLKRNITVFAAVEPFIKVTAQHKRYDELDENCDDDEEAFKSGGEKGTVANENRRKPTVFVVRRISSFLWNGETHVVFSAIGTTAIFEFVLTETDGNAEIRHHDFGKPVIDFTLCGEGLIWVLLDADFLEESVASDERPRKLVQAIQWSDEQKFVDSDNLPLLDSLNSRCSLPATVDDLKALDLYSDLSSLPKSVDVEQGTRFPEQMNPAFEPLEDDDVEANALTKRALGRLKHKRALQLHHEKIDGSDLPGPDTKKTRADSNIVHSGLVKE